MTQLFNSETTIEQFLSEVWQRKPLLLRGAFPALQNPVTPDELAGYACDEDSNARLVLESCGERPWSVEYGPFDESRFASLPESGWSLLVSDMERLVPDIRELQQGFRFVPDWRVDDVMISYAPDGGSVGPHLDHYDVFLLQTHGRRRWMIDENPRHEFLPDTDLEILTAFNAQQEWLLEPGDMLYLPPGVAHHGIADGECMTCSIGFRTPSSTQLASEFIEQRCRSLAASLYTDAGLQRQTHNAEISAVSLAKLRTMIEQVTTFDDDDLAAWFGCYISENRSASHVEAGDEIRQRSTRLLHNPRCRFLFTRTSRGCLLFVDGDSFEVSTGFAETLCADRHVDRRELQSRMQADDADVFERLIEEGYLVADDA